MRAEWRTRVTCTENNVKKAFAKLTRSKKSELKSNANTAIAAAASRRATTTTTLLGEDVSSQPSTSPVGDVDEDIAALIDTAEKDMEAVPAEDSLL